MEEDFEDEEDGEEYDDYEGFEDDDDLDDGQQTDNLSRGSNDDLIESPTSKRNRATLKTNGGMSAKNAGRMG